MLDVLADNPVLTLFLVVGLGSALGLVPFGPIRFGPAGALFVGLALGAMDERLGEGLGLAGRSGWPCSSTPSGCPRARSSSAPSAASCPPMAGSAAVSGLTDLTVVVGRRARLADVPGRPSGWCGSRTGGAGGSVEVATGDAVMEPGDRLRVVVPRGRMPEVTRFLGDTERRVNEGYATRSPGPVAGRPPSRFFDDRGRVGFGHD